MADYYTQFSEVLVLDEKHKERTLQICERFNTGLELGGEFLDVQYNWEDQAGLWLCAEEYGNLDQLADLVQTLMREFDLDGVFVASWSISCSKMRPSEFDGGAVAVSKDKMIWVNARDEVEKKVEKEWGKHVR